MSPGLPPEADGAAGAAAQPVQAAPSEAAGAAAFRRVHPLHYHQAFLAQGVRPDGRGLLRGRRAAASAAVVSSADGSAMAKLGQTTVLAGVQAVPTLPSEAEPGEGRVVVTLDQPLAGGERGGQARQEREQSALSELLQRSAAGMADGNLTDACLLAMLVALSDTALPAVRFSTGEGEGEDGTARAEEEALLSTSFTLLLDSDGAFRGLHKPGGAPLDEATTRESLAAARKRLPALVAASSAKRAGLRF
ncbi:hypothetical protein EMIHUDRAFT_105607 [Emiliania huxleyi CCMP1516]|uniref:Ribosomal RNA-processing protein 43 n=2 Tax=Emiliania huxleyi TaxID=2903 RepID=A0A0D3ID86_EMIH1|nr:hypothetical protein EMIHUDRAFT_105607 [Emiliania huxleyi CCMP1516]EOD09221.1 hypothetical protein EMIHUDRAFT_105607 [Emiliania huxleyi CCMP1516]|eukprot:XP_005761650.1 hypothetical protein EMIHUDRAFT_105607 [Emiliania huxleyi CCMP1516]